MYMNDCTDCYAVPGSSSIIDVIHPETGLTWCYGKTEAEVLAKEPLAVRMTVEAWCAAKAERQHTPIEWHPTTREQYQDMLGCLPPAYWQNGDFLVGEPSDHDASSGAPRFQAYRQRGDVYTAASRPMTIAEIRRA